ncbi:B3 domain-containing protein LOC_Os12g40080-like [Tripterygium wilfordii]|uniref:B3 domain-containing protein LOC_Os12g40080-like n=1 Tax=Tripterygium wilfordii TaxID=458696 RepID=UPI0018F7EA67|nr:B3 domain-containing protein LOC_Os12g40080-like [Tripterygium wilfordii]
MMCKFEILHLSLVKRNAAVLQLPIFRMLVNDVDCLWQQACLPGNLTWLGKQLIYKIRPDPLTMESKNLGYQNSTGTALNLQFQALMVSQQLCGIFSHHVWLRVLFYFVITITYRKTSSSPSAIPRKFMKLYGSELPDSVCLRVPSGAVWQVGLSKHGENVWLQNGWREFSEYYSLDYGHLLVFELEGCNQFSVFMFDKSATETKYPYNNPVCSEEPKHNGEYNEPNMREKTEDDDSIEMLGRSPLPCSYSQMKMKHDSTSQIEQKCSLTSKIYVEACKRASDFQSVYPYFKVVLGPTYLHRGNGLAIPAAFAKKYLTEKRMDITLYVPEGRTWSAKCHRRDKRFYLIHGWHKFACDNGLKVDDVCFFELIKISEIKLKVAIFQVNHGIHFAQGHESTPKRVSHMKKNCSQYSTRLKTGTSHCCMRESGEGDKTLMKNGGMSTGLRCPKAEVVEQTLSLNSKEISQAFERARAFQSENPFFKLLIHPSYVPGAVGFAGVTIPSKFARKYLREMQSDVTLCVSDKRVWTAEYRQSANKSYSKTKLYHGWREFVRDNSLKVGDVCVFELIEISKIKFKVVIFRVIEDLNNQQSLGHGSGPNRVEPKRSLEKNTVSDCACNLGEPCIDFRTNRQAKKLKQKFDCKDETLH